MSFNVNDLVRVKSAKSIGICCVAKVHKNQCTINVGTTGTMKVSHKNLEPINTADCKTVTAYEYSSRILRDNSKLNQVIVGNELKEYVGIGWITLRVITEEDLKKYPRVI